jgi:hypothetical protein
VDAVTVMGTISNLREHRRPPYDQATEPVYEPDQAWQKWMSLSPLEWSLVVDALTKHDLPQYRRLGALLRERLTSSSEALHPSNQGGAS